MAGSVAFLGSRNPLTVRTDSRGIRFRTPAKQSRTVAAEAGGRLSGYRDGDTIDGVRRNHIEHGDVVEIRYLYLTPVNQPDVIVLVRDPSSEVARQERAYFLRRHPDGQFCEGHIHDSLDEARSCRNRKELGPLWSNLAIAVARISMRSSP
jgi:hypothetical protein